MTKKAIANSFLGLLQEKPLEKITVKEIVEDCGINRNTFYYHFDDIPSLLELILREETERVLGEHLGEESWEEGFIAAARFALENKKIIYHIYNSVNREIFERYLNRIAQDVMDRFVGKVSERINVSAEDKKLIAAFYKSALTGMIMDWLASGMQYEPEPLIRRLGTMLDGEILRALERAAV
ncbi:TetR/AcrR family transcriptional regulator [Ruminococcus sp. YH-rum2234]|uniref:TetR/AcrR family transcriptional regulator n=1 Tax=Fusibacillus kribbianus TaxID=3044208 RepID=A0AAP4B8Y7_9FIRM|nr:TetR/AcrR family transcriptional regulator [Ruminococcus sp. YH-rum2234]